MAPSHNIRYNYVWRIMKMTSAYLCRLVDMCIIDYLRTNVFLSNRQPSHFNTIWERVRIYKNFLNAHLGAVLTYFWIPNSQRNTKRRGVQQRDISVIFFLLAWNTLATSGSSHASQCQAFVAAYFRTSVHNSSVSTTDIYSTHNESVQKLAKKAIWGKGRPFFFQLNVSEK